MEKSVEVIVGADGSITIEAIGFQGKTCADVTTPLAKLLGTVTADKKKADYYAKPALIVGTLGQGGN